MGKKTIYFICTGNSCRSQIGKKYLGDHFYVYSAGVEAHGLNPKAIQVMAEVGVDISSQTSDILDTVGLSQADYVITLCGDAHDRCPITPPNVKRDHWGFDDPARAEGSEEEKLRVFRRVRDEIEERIKRFSRDKE